MNLIPTKLRTLSENTLKVKRYFAKRINETLISNFVNLKIPAYPTKRNCRSYYSTKNLTLSNSRKVL